jgi:nucleotide-binding universal stress UspA family protein/uncharacterized membrane protein (DUF485 family)
MRTEPEYHDRTGSTPLGKKDKDIIVLATDGSASALAATMRAVNHAKREGKVVHIITVSGPSPLIGIEKLAEDYAVGRRCKVDGVWFAEAYAQEQKVPFRTIKREGPVAGIIVEYANEVSAELIVLGSSNLRGVAGFVLGDVSEAVLRLSPCTVWAVKPTQREMDLVVSKVRSYAKPKPAVATPDLIPDKRLWHVAMGMFLLYVTAYGMFTIAGTFMKGLLGIRVGGLNLAIVSGMGIIIGAVVIALAYNWYAGTRDTQGTEMKNGI